MNKVWNYLDGKKTLITGIIGGLWLIFQTAYPDVIPEKTEDIINYFLVNVFGIGIGAKAQKKMGKK